MHCYIKKVAGNRTATKIVNVKVLQLLTLIVL